MIRAEAATHFIRPNWPCADNVKAISTLRTGGFSQNPYTSFNLSNTVGDDNQSVEMNMEKLVEDAKLPNTPMWLVQEHSSRVISIDHYIPAIAADAIISDKLRQVCAIRTADCLPILLSHRDGTEIAAIHAGWRGLLNGIVDNTINAMHSDASELIAWLGPCISSDCFEVGEDVRTPFCQRDETLSLCFTSSKKHKWLADLQGIARHFLKNLGVNDIYADHGCTYREAEKYYSYRRDGSQSGRMATLIWLDD